MLALALESELTLAPTLKLRLGLEQVLALVQASASALGLGLWLGLELGAELGLELELELVQARAQVQSHVQVQVQARKMKALQPQGCQTSRRHWKPRKQLEGKCWIDLTLAQKMEALDHQHWAEPQQQEQ